MPKLPQLSGAELVKALQKLGFEVVGQKGSHIKLLHPDGRVAIVPNHKVIKSTHDSTEFIGWSKADRTAFPNLKTTTESISLRLPSPLLARLKGLANERDVPYQSLLKVYLSERVDHELHAKK